MEFESFNPEEVATLENMISGSLQISTTEMIDISIQDARDKKKTIDSKMDSVMSFMREVERMEKAAEQAKQQSDEYSLNILGQVDELKRAKEKNDMRAGEVYSQKAALANEMKEVEFRVLGVLNEGDGSLSDLDEMRRSLAKRLTSALFKKDAADKQKSENEALFAYQKSEMEMAVQEAKRLEQEAMENSELQEFLKDRGHVVDMLRDEISRIRLDVDLLKEELGDHMGAEEQPLMPIIQGPLVRQGCECGKCNDVLECFKGAAKNTLRSNRICKRHLTNAKNKTMMKWIEEQITEAMTEYKQDRHYYVFDEF